MAALLAAVLALSEGIVAPLFKVAPATALFAFARTPADAAIIEVGLGGRLDATNVIPAPAICGITQLGLDHQAFLGSKVEGIAAEKAGIAKRGVPLVTQHYQDAVANRIGEAAAAAGAIWLPRGGRWEATAYQQQLHYRDEWGKLDLPLPRLRGAHQAMNAGLAIAMLRHQRAVSVRESALRAAMGWAEWPARLQRLARGPLQDLLPNGSELWLDGGHNPAAPRAIADFFRASVPASRPLHLIFGLLENKDAAGVLKPFRNRAITLHTVPVEGHAHHSPAALAATAREGGFKALPSTDVESALGWIARHADRAAPPIVLILGSLYLAGEVLRKNDQAPS